jgi:hypothetical protein
LVGSGDELFAVTTGAGPFEDEVGFWETGDVVVTAELGCVELPPPASPVVGDEPIYV